MRINVSNTLDDLASDTERIATTTRPRLTRVVSKSVKQGNREARRIARAASGIHGLNYYKRITSEMTGPLSGEFGPTGDVANNAVGAGWRHGPGNTDLPKAADIIGPRFAKDVVDLVDGLFWGAEA